MNRIRLASRKCPTIRKQMPVATAPMITTVAVVTKRETASPSTPIVDAITTSTIEDGTAVIESAPR